MKPQSYIRGFDVVQHILLYYKRKTVQQMAAQLKERPGTISSVCRMLGVIAIRTYKRPGPKPARCKVNPEIVGKNLPGLKIKGIPGVRHNPTRKVIKASGTPARDAGLIDCRPFPYRNLNGSGKKAV